MTEIRIPEELLGVLPASILLNIQSLDRYSKVPKVMQDQFRVKMVVEGKKELEANKAAGLISDNQMKKAHAFLEKFMPSFD